MRREPARRSEGRGGALGLIPASICALVLASVPGFATGQELHVERDSVRLVRFVSRAPLDNFDGVTTQIDGFVVLPGGLKLGSPPSGSRLYLEVDLASIETGISLRDRHMRDNYLDTKDFPYATFEADISEVSQPTPGVFRVSASGGLAIHGVTTKRILTCETQDPVPPHRVACEFSVNLTDHDISIPSLMFMKIADEVRVSLEFLLAEPG